MDRFGTLSLLLVLAPSAAIAAPLPKAAVLSPIASGSTDKGFAGAVERLIRVRIDELKAVEGATTPALSLPELQLAVGCVGETWECLKAVADQLEVAVLVLSHIDRTGEEIVLSIGLYDVRANADPKRTVRRAKGGRAESDMLDEVDGALRELFGLPPAPKKLVAVTVAEPAPIAPIVVMGAGAVVAGIGGVFGLIARGGENDYASAPIRSRAEVDHALELKDSAEGKATAANVLFVVGAVGIATGAAWFFWPSSSSSSSSSETPALSLVPVVGAEGGGLVLGGSL